MSEGLRVIHVAVVLLYHTKVVSSYVKLSICSSVRVFNDCHLKGLRAKKQRKDVTAMKNVYDSLTKTISHA
ncbi:hypothetical protein GCM10007877_19860 [Marinibactrum halimedae]|uniref:Uncharacterized protein n=1 Tax=Marinibactrum halimedae TaxID=1444977 RepID=A0AA37WNM5_9GAMM|nr:hypothetical protein GCM10007877_19860 [Marinibactrum halimedae]